MTTTPSWCKRLASEWDTVAAIAGVLLVRHGLAAIWPPLAWLWLGGCCLAVALRAARTKRTRRP